ncbi:MAG: S-layer protein, partial [Candidatus Cloacimonetes bacterium]|nr:S-layer protein [Candidatus Cloacimonadota bacterium]
AMTNYGISQVTLQIREGINNLTGEIIATVHTDINGYYLFNDIEAGNYTISCSHVDFVETSFSVICLGGVNSDNQSTVMSPLMNEDEIRIILTWGSSPRDLDSHLTGPIPESEQRFHIYYANKNFYYDDTLYANLDIDDVSSYGPETTTIYVPSQGLYRFSVYDYSNGGYSNSSALSNSSAQVSVWKGNNNIQTYHVPTGEIGTVWTVFELSGNQIIGINTISNDTSYKNEELNWQQLPQK